MTTFPLVPVVLDPYTNESAWILDTARRVLDHFKGAGCRPCWIVTCPIEDARTYLGPYADEFSPRGSGPPGCDRPWRRGSPCPAARSPGRRGDRQSEGWNADEWRGSPSRSLPSPIGAVRPCRWRATRLPTRNADLGLIRLRGVPVRQAIRSKIRTTTAAKPCRAVTVHFVVESATIARCTTVMARTNGNGTEAITRPAFSSRSGRARGRYD